MMGFHVKRVGQKKQPIITLLSANTPAQAEWAAASVGREARESQTGGRLENRGFRAVPPWR
jgi:hypothetical protein